MILSFVDNTSILNIASYQKWIIELRRCLFSENCLVLLMSFLSSLSYFKPPNDIISSVEYIFNWFFWEEIRKISWIKWNTICRNTEDKRLGVRRLKEFNLALIGKWFRRLYELSENKLAIVVEMLSLGWGVGEAMLRSWGEERLMSVRICYLILFCMMVSRIGEFSNCIRQTFSS